MENLFMAKVEANVEGIENVGSYTVHSRWIDLSGIDEVAEAADFQRDKHGNKILDENEQPIPKKVTALLRHYGGEGGRQAGDFEHVGAYFARSGTVMEWTEKVERAKRAAAGILPEIEEAEKEAPAGE